MYSRDLVKDLRIWREKSNRKPLVLRGARQVGKTTLVDEFGKEFDHYIKLNLERQADREIFARTDSAKEVAQYLYLREGITDAKSQSVLLFIDEIQDSPIAVTMLRYFYEDVPDLYVIAAGSRLQKLLKKKAGDEEMLRRSFPVGRVEYLNLRPFSFFEFLSASGKQAWRERIEDVSVPDLLHDDLKKAFNIYALIGGMPEVVSHYLEHRDIVALRDIYDSLTTGYMDDAEDYAKNEAQTRTIRHILNTGWAEAGRAITFSRFGNSDYTSTQIHEAMELLAKAFVLSLDYPVTSTKIPTVPALRRSPKLVWMDNGLVNYKVGIQQEYLQNKNLLDTWRGQAAEHVVAQELRVLLDQNRLDEQCFWVRDKQGTNAEVDFVWQQGGMLIPIEVKSGSNARLQSLHSFVDNSDQPVTAVRIWNEPFSVNDLMSIKGKPFRLINIPFYMIGALETIIERYGLQ